LTSSKFHNLVYEITPEAIIRFVEFSQIEYQSGGPTSISVVTWRHLTNPSGRSVAVEIENDLSLIGRIWVQFNHWIVNGKEIKVASPIDFLIHPEFRRLQVFLSLFRNGIQVSNKNADLTLHTSNPLTDGLYRDLMRQVPVTELDGALFPLRPFALIIKKRSCGLSQFITFGDFSFSKLVRIACKVFAPLGVTFASEPTVDEQKVLIQKFQKDECISRRRSPNDRAWRFEGAGDFNYRVQWIKKGKSFIGYVAWTDRLIDRVHGRFIVDIVLIDSPSWLTTTSIWLKLAVLTLQDEIHALFFFYNKRNTKLRQIASLPMLTVSRSRLPQQVPIFLRFPETDQHDLKNLDWSTGYFVLSDLDLF
jgi:hypothetical protein